MDSSDTSASPTEGRRVLTAADRAISTVDDDLLDGFSATERTQLEGALLRLFTASGPTSNNPAGAVPDRDPSSGRGPIGYTGYCELHVLVATDEGRVGAGDVRLDRIAVAFEEVDALG